MELSLFIDIILHCTYFLLSTSKRNIGFSIHAIVAFLAGNEKIILRGSTFSASVGRVTAAYNCFIIFLLVTLMKKEYGNPDAYKPAGCLSMIQKNIVAAAALDCFAFPVNVMLTGLGVFRLKSEKLFDRASISPIARRRLKHSPSLSIPLFQAARSRRNGTVGGSSRGLRTW